MGRLCQGQNRPGPKAELRARRVGHPHQRADPQRTPRQVQVAQCISHPGGEAAAAPAMATG
eukprot:29016-Pyramimonas_sp.AAC.1